MRMRMYGLFFIFTDLKKITLLLLLLLLPFILFLSVSIHSLLLLLLLHLRALLPPSAFLATIAMAIGVSSLSLSGLPSLLSFCLLTKLHSHVLLLFFFFFLGVCLCTRETICSKMMPRKRKENAQEWYVLIPSLPLPFSHISSFCLFLFFSFSSFSSFSWSHGYLDILFSCLSL